MKGWILVLNASKPRVTKIQAHNEALSATNENQAYSRKILMYDTVQRCTVLCMLEKIY